MFETHQVYFDDIFMPEFWFTFFYVTLRVQDLFHKSAVFKSIQVANPS